VTAALNRRNALVLGGVLFVGFSLRGTLAQTLPGGLAGAPFLDSWIRIDRDGVTVITGKVEIGQGIKTALLQIAAEELDVPVTTLKLITGDTELTPNEGYTAGSMSVSNGGVAIQHAAAQVRALLVAEAARRAKLPAEKMAVADGVVIAPDGQRFPYGELAGAVSLHVEARAQSKLKDPAAHKVMNTSARRVDLPAKVTGGAAFVHDLRLPGMLHGRIVHPPSYQAKLLALDAGAVEKMPGVVKVVRDGHFLAVIADQEYRAAKAMRALAAAARWETPATLPKKAELAQGLLKMTSRDEVIHEVKGPAPTGKTIEASYFRPYHAHASMGPACAVAQLVDGKYTVWTASQGVFMDRAAIADMLRVPLAQVRCIHMEGPGCYGHNGADDAAADAALLARALPGKPIRVQWTREQEHGWEPYGSAMVGKARATLASDGTIAAWDYQFWSHTHVTRPSNKAGSFIAARHLAEPFEVPPPMPAPLPAGGGSRNSVPYYKFPAVKVTEHFLPEMPVRVSALRALGGYANVFAIECFMDELAAAAGADPVAFRLKHLDDPRAREVVERTAKEFGWNPGHKAPADRGYGFGFARYKNSAAYCAVAAEVEVAPRSGHVRLVRAVSAVDAGQVVNPDGLANQIEGGIIQSASWTLYEAVTFDRVRITSTDWRSYPILTFSDAPDSVAIHVINRPGAPFLGAGEASQGPAAAAIGNAVANAARKRLRKLPLAPKKPA
jgi:CO/xanthine dehydrogenase Mo-binding subunit